MQQQHMQGQQRLFISSACSQNKITAVLPLLLLLYVAASEFSLLRVLKTKSNSVKKAAAAFSSSARFQK